MFSDWYGHRAACTLQSAPQFGKSKLAESMMRTHVGFDGFTLCDPHGPSYDAMVRYITYVRPACPVYLFNPSEPDCVTPFNFIRFKGGDPLAHASRISGSIIHGWGMDDSDEMPTYERVMKSLIYVSAVSGEPLHHVARLLDKWEKNLREWAISIVKDDGIRSDLIDLHAKSLFQTPVLWERDVLSVRNRLKRFTDSPIVRMFTGLPGGIDISTVWDQSAILLCKFTESDYLSAESAKVFGSILQSEFLHAARLRMNDPKPHYVYFDEYQEYATSDALPLIMQTPKSGLRLTLITHHSAEFHKKPYIPQALEMAQIKIAMGGLPYKLAYDLVPDFLPEELNRRKKKDDKIHYITYHDLEEHQTIGESVSWMESTVHTESTNTGFSFGTANSSGSFSGASGDDEHAVESYGESSGFSETSSETDGYGESKSQGSSRGGSRSVQTGTRYRPRVERIVDGQEDYSLEEKRAQLAAGMMGLDHQQALLKLPGGDAKLRMTPWVEEVLLDYDTVLKYSKENSTYLFDAAQQQLKDQERTFLERSTPLDSPSRPKKRLGGLHPQK